MKISVVSPVYFGEQLVDELVSRLDNSLRQLSDDYEIILVEDGSPDNSWESIAKACSINSKVKGIKLSRNFGQHYAISCGLEYANGDWIVVMDCDLQDRPEEIGKLLEKALTGYDIVFAQRVDRQDTFLKRMSSLAFYKVFSYLTDTNQDPSVANFGIYSKKVINAVLSMQDTIRYFPTLVQWVGFNSTKIKVEHNARLDGHSSYSWKKLLTLAAKNIIAFSNKPLVIFVKLGMFISFLSFISGLIYLYKYFTGQIEVLGFTSIIITINFLAGLIILIIGVVGIYLARTFEQVKGRPRHIVEKEIN